MQLPSSSRTAAPCRLATRSSGVVGSATEHSTRYHRGCPSPARKASGDRETGLIIIMKWGYFTIYLDIGPQF